MAEFNFPTPDDSAVLFDYNGLATKPYFLREAALGVYYGDSLQALRAGGFNHLPYGRYLILPPNYGAVVLLDNGEHKAFLPGRHELARALGGRKPVSLQFVNLQAHSYTVSGLEVRTKDNFRPALDLRLSLVVSAPEKVINWRDPQPDIQAAIQQGVLSGVLALTHHDLSENIIALVQNAGVRDTIAQNLAEYGLTVRQLFVSNFKPDPKFDDLRYRKEFAKLRSYVERLEAQVDEDIAAMKQPANRRNVMTMLGAQARERNHAARMEAIDAVSQMAKLLFEDFQRNPGRVYSQKDMEPLMKALGILEKLTEQVPAPPVPQQVRSEYAVDANQPTPPPLGPDPFTKARA